jgi:hypothetical protein
LKEYSDFYLFEIVQASLRMETKYKIQNDKNSKSHISRSRPVYGFEEEGRLATLRHRRSIFQNQFSLWFEIVQASLRMETIRNHQISKCHVSRSRLVYALDEPPHGFEDEGRLVSLRHRRSIFQNTFSMRFEIVQASL